MLKISHPSPPQYPFIISVSENSTYWNHPKKQNSFVDSMVGKHRRVPPTKQFTLNISAIGFIGFRKWRPESWRHSRATERYQLEVLAPIWHCGTNSRVHLKVNLTFPDSPQRYTMTSGAFLRNYFLCCDWDKSRLYMSFPRVFSRFSYTISGVGEEREQGNRHNNFKKF